MPFQTHNVSPLLPDESGKWPRGCRRGWLGVLGGVLASLMSPSLLRTAESDPTLEYKIKAGYLINFAKFIEWPAQAFSAPNSPFVIGVLDDAAAKAVIEQIIGGMEAHGHSVQVVAVSVASLPSSVHILMVTRAAQKSVEEIRASLRGRATLVVGETEQFAEQGGMIGFVWEKEAIRVTLNLECAKEADLKVSAKLANVAKVVKTKRDK